MVTKTYRADCLTSVGSQKMLLTLWVNVSVKILDNTTIFSFIFSFIFCMLLLTQHYLFTIFF